MAFAVVFLGGLGFAKAAVADEEEFCVVIVGDTICFFVDDPEEGACMQFHCCNGPGNPEHQCWEET
jgi:hypothetical protein